jgi:uncharacterized phage infection (PIP) family protein YhgE
VSTLDDNIQSVDAVREHYTSALNQLKSAISEAEQGAEQGAALGVDGLVELFGQVKSGLEAIVEGTGALDERLDAVIAVLESAKG